MLSVWLGSFFYVDLHSFILFNSTNSLINAHHSALITFFPKKGGKILDKAESLLLQGRHDTTRFLRFLPKF